MYKDKGKVVSVHAVQTFKGSKGRAQLIP